MAAEDQEVVLRDIGRRSASCAARRGSPRSRRRCCSASRCAATASSRTAARTCSQPWGATSRRGGAGREGRGPLHAADHEGEARRAAEGRAVAGAVGLTLACQRAMALHETASPTSVNRAAISSRDTPRCAASRSTRVR